MASKTDRPCGEWCNRSTCGPTICHGRIPWDELPCREFCNHYAGGKCAPGRCGSPYTRDDPRYWLGRGSEPVAGQSFGWAHNMEEAAIRAHLIKRGHDPNGFAFHHRASRLHMRLQRDYHRRKPPTGVRRIVKVEAPPEFTRAELEHMLDLFADANHPVTRGIADKIERMLAR